MNELILQSKEIFDRAVLDFKPKAVVLMLSGGDDSLTTHHVARELGIKFDYVIHGNTRTGIEETTSFVRAEVNKYNIPYLEADAGDSYVKYLIRKGFFGIGTTAHNYSYHVLKADHFRRVVSKYLRKRKRNFPVLFINGARKSESENRKVSMLNPYRRDPAAKQNIWVNLINDWDKPDCLSYLDGNGIKRNPVAVSLCRSGECMCGTMQSKGDRIEAAYFYPEWGARLDALEKHIKELHGFGWGENKPKQKDINQLSLFQPMCIGCIKEAI